MNFRIECNGIDISTDIVNYNREEKICDSSGLIEIQIQGNTNKSIEIGDTIVLYEEGSKRLTYSINTREHDLNTNLIMIVANNGQRDLMFSFIDSYYSIYETPTYKTRYWIEKFLTEANVSYSFDTSSLGEYISDDITLGGVSTMEQIQQLLEFSGWYMRFDSNNNAVIGNLNYDTGSYSLTVDDSQILNISIIKDDKILRNRVVVWGKGIINTNKWVFSDMSINTAWNYDSSDKRSILIANSMIPDSASAASIAKKALNEFTRINYIKRITVAGSPNITIGDRINIQSRFFNGIGLLTSMSVSMSENGFITELILDERCPRLIGYLNFEDSYVYIGTEADGVWRKPLRNTHVWSDFSSGMTDLNIKDLDIYNGVYSAVSDGGKLYLRYVGDSSWRTFYPYGLVDYYGEGGETVPYTYNDVYCAGATINRGNNNIIAAYNLNDSITVLSGVRFVEDTARSWVVDISSNDFYTVKQVHIDSISTIAVNDIAHDGGNIYLSAYASGDAQEDFGTIHKVLNQQNQPELFNSMTQVVASGYVDTIFDLSEVGSTRIDHYRGTYGKYIYMYELSGSSLDIRRVDINDSSVTEVNLTLDNEIYLNQLMPIDNDLAVLLVSDYTYSPDYVETVYAYEINFDSIAATYKDSYTLTSPQETVGYVGGCKYEGKHYFCIGIMDYWDSPSHGERVHFLDYNYEDNLLTFLTGTPDGGYNQLKYGYESFAYVGEGTIVGLTCSEMNDPYDTYYDQYFIAIDLPNRSVMYTAFDYSLNSPRQAGDYCYYRAAADEGQYITADFENGCAYILVTKGVVQAVSYLSKNALFKVDSSANVTLVDDTIMNSQRYLINSKDTVYYIYRDATQYYIKNLMTNTVEFNLPRKSGANDYYYDFVRFCDDDNDGILIHTRLYSGSDPDWDKYDNQIDLYVGGSVQSTLTGFSASYTSNFLSMNEHFYLKGETLEMEEWSRISGNDYGKLHVRHLEDYEPTDLANLTASPLLKFENGEFEELFGIGANVSYLDSSWGYPLMVYGGDDFNNEGYLGAMLTVDPGDYAFFNLIYNDGGLTGGHFVSDARSFFMIYEDELRQRGVFVTGTQDISEQSYLRLIDFDSFNALEVDITTNFWYGFTGVVNHIETTNTQDVPYIFVSTFTDDVSDFYQKDGRTRTAEETTFTERNTNLPTSKINVIRTDDII